MVNGKLSSELLTFGAPEGQKASPPRRQPLEVLALVPPPSRHPCSPLRVRIPCPRPVSLAASLAHHVPALPLC